jgi:hypothetical protein
MLTAVKAQSALLAGILNSPHIPAFNADRFTLWHYRVFVRHFSPSISRIAFKYGAMHGPDAGCIFPSASS